MKSLRVKLRALGVVFSFFLLGFNAAYASNICSNSPDAVHCAGMAGGVPEDIGKYVQVEWVTTGPHYLTAVCANNTLSVSLDGDDILDAIKAGVIKELSPKTPVGITLRFWQCSDAQCTNRQLLGIDEFKLSESGDRQNYITYPKVYNIPILDKNYGYSCTPPAVPKQDVIKKLLSEKK